MKILFATDGSKDARAAGRFLERLPLPEGTHLQVLTVVTATGWPVSENLHGLLLEWADRTTREEAAAQERAGVTVTCASRSGEEAHEILHAADAMGADLVVVGSRGRTGLEGFLIGSVARNVAKHARRPVLVARAPRAELRTALLAVDESEHARDAARFAAALPLPPETDVRVCHVTRPYHPFGLANPESQAVLDELAEEIRVQSREKAEKLVEGARAGLEAAGKHAAAVVREGDPGSEILREAEECHADLIIAGARGVSLIRGLVVGSVADRLLKAAHCSVLIVH